MTYDLDEDDAEEVVEAVNEADLENADDADEAAQIVEREADGSLSDSQLEAAKTVAAAGVVASGSALGPAGIALSAPAAGYIVMEADSVVGAYKDGYDQLKQIGSELFE